MSKILSGYSRKDTDLQEELNDTVQKLYEKYVPQATREYLDDKISREPKVRERPRRPTRAAASSEGSIHQEES